MSAAGVSAPVSKEKGFERCYSDRGRSTFAIIWETGAMEGRWGVGGGGGGLWLVYKLPKKCRRDCTSLFQTWVIDASAVPYTSRDFGHFACGWLLVTTKSSVRS